MQERKKEEHDHDKYRIQIAFLFHDVGLASVDF
jgi:hypothetical protein